MASRLRLRRGTDDVRRGGCFVGGEAVCGFEGAARVRSFILSILPSPASAARVVVLTLSSIYSAYYRHRDRIQVLEIALEPNTPKLRVFSSYFPPFLILIPYRLDLAGCTRLSPSSTTPSEASPTPRNSPTASPTCRASSTISARQSKPGRAVRSLVTTPSR